jgi:hypothetical protein
MGWDFLTCMHGKTEGLDSHDCAKCLIIAKKLGYDTSNGKTYIFTESSYKASLKEKNLTEKDFNQL